MNSKAKNKYAFLKNDKLNDEAKNACKVLHIDQQLLVAKTKDSFKQGDANDQLAEIRYYHYEEKRKALLDEIDQYLLGLNVRNTSTSFMQR